LTEEAKIVLGITGLITILILLVTVVILTFAPAVLLIFGMWDAFAYWFPIVMVIARFLYFFSFVIGIIYMFLGKMTYVVSSIIDLIMLIWGVPVYQNAVMSLGYSQLSGLELQRTILLIILIEATTITSSLVTKKSE
jgi:hypothetical protein